MLILEVKNTIFDCFKISEQFNPGTVPVWTVGCDWCLCGGATGRAEGRGGIGFCTIGDLILHADPVDRRILKHIKQTDLKLFFI